MCLFVGLCDNSSPPQYIVFIICLTAALLHLCCPPLSYSIFPLARRVAAAEHNEQDVTVCDCGNLQGLRI